MGPLIDFSKTMEKITEADNRYKAEAYDFVMKALEFTVSKLGNPRHISGQELLEGIRKYALQQFGPLARTVLQHWGVRCTEDFGEIVFNMVEASLMGKTAQEMPHFVRLITQIPKTRGHRFSFEVICVICLLICVIKYRKCFILSYTSR